MGLWSFTKIKQNDTTKNNLGLELNLSGRYKIASYGLQKFENT